MTCCGGDAVADSVAGTSQQLARETRSRELARQGIVQNDGSVHFTLSCPDIHCGNCISAIERALSGMEGVREVRVNLTLKRVAIVLEDETVAVMPVVDEMERMGYRAFPFDFSEDPGEDRRGSELLRALAVAGFAAMNVMLLSVSNWSGADGATRDLFHLISAIIAIPAIAYSGRIFFRSAWAALRSGRMNMDVPISIGVLLATGMSLYETLNHGEEAYFDAATSLLFFLLIGRYLDQRMRERARNAVIGLSRLAVKGANVVEADGSLHYYPIDEIEPGMRLRILPGERIPVDGFIASGTSDLDLSLVTGENEPVALGEGAVLQAGTYNLTGPLEMEATRPASRSFLAEVSEMLGAAERGRGYYVRIADRMARYYSPVVHILALAAFIWWMFLTGDVRLSIYVAIALLIITCPCALGLAVPAVHVIAASRLFEEGILVKDGSALERIAEVDHAVFDKTGTLTDPVPQITDAPFPGQTERMLAHALASYSSHPASRALAAHLAGSGVMAVEEVREVAGRGIEAVFEGRKVRLGADDWVGEIASGSTEIRSGTGISFAIEGLETVHCSIRERLRDGAHEAVNALVAAGMPVEILSGDKEAPVAAIAGELGVAQWHSANKPADKIAHIEALKSQGKHPLMVGDGLNDAPCLAAGHASMAPASASDIGRAAADFVFTRDRLDAVPFAIEVSHRARDLVRQNIAMALVYNCVAVPIAFAGYVTPLIAAIAMSASSIVVVTNSLRLARFRRRRVETGRASDHAHGAWPGREQAA